MKKYRIKKFKKRKFMRKKFRKFKTKKGTKTKIYSTPFQKNMKVKMFTRSTPLAMSKGSLNTCGYDYIRVNNTSPYNWFTSLQPQYHDQLSYVYRSFRVYGCKYKLTFTLGPSALSDDTHTRGVAILVTPHDTANIFGFTTPQMIPKDVFYKAGQNPGCQLKQLHWHPDQKSSVTFKGYIDFAKIYGKETITDLEYSGSKSSPTPAKSLYLNMYFCALHPLDEVNAISLELCASMTQYVKYSERDTGVYDG